MVLSWCKLNCGFGPWILNHYKLKQLGTIIINTLCPLEIIYSCSIKIHASGFDKLLKSIFCLLLVVEGFSLQNIVEMLEEVVGERSGEYGEMRQNSSPICSTSEVLVVQCAVKHCYAEELGPFCWAMPAAGVAVFDATHRFAEHTIQMKWLLWDSERCSGSDWQQITFFWCKFGFGKCFEASSQSNHLAGHHQLSYKIHFFSHITVRLRNGLLLHRIREDNTLKWNFWFVVSSRGTHLLSFFTFPICCQGQMPNHRRADTEFFSNFSCSWKRISFDDPLNWSLSTANGQPLRSSLRLWSPLQNFLNHHCTVHSLAVPGPNALLIVQVFAAVLQLIFNLNKRIAPICFFV